MHALLPCMFYTVPRVFSIYIKHMTGSYPHARRITLQALIILNIWGAQIRVPTLKLLPLPDINIPTTHWAQSI